MRAATCEVHPGIRLNPDCYKCGPKEEPMTEEVTVRARLNGGEWTDPVPLAALPQLSQPTLSDTLFPPVRRADVPLVKLSISGTIELTQEQYQAYLDGQRLGPGAVVEVRAGGYVVQPGAAWVRRVEKSEARYNHATKDFEGGGAEVRYESEGRIKIKLVWLGDLSATGGEFEGE